MSLTSGLVQSGPSSNDRALPSMKQTNIPVFTYTEVVNAVAACSINILPLVSINIKGTSCWLIWFGCKKISICSLSTSVCFSSAKKQEKITYGCVLPSEHQKNTSHMSNFLNNTTSKEK